MGRMFNIFFHCTDSVDCIGLLSVKHPILHCILVTQINSSNTVKLSVSDKPEKGKHCNVQLQHYHWTGENLLKTNNGSSLGRGKHYCEMFWVKDRNSVDIIIPNTNYILSTKKERRLCPNFQYYFRNVRLRVYICMYRCHEHATAMHDST